MFAGVTCFGSKNIYKQSRYMYAKLDTCTGTSSILLALLVKLAKCNGDIVQGSALFVELT